MAIPDYYQEAAMTDMTCEVHPGKPWPHDNCPGPGMPWENCERLLAEKDAEIERLREITTCDSCGCDIRGPKDDFLCFGCGKYICMECCSVFGHYGQEEHGLGNPHVRIREWRDELTTLRQRVAELQEKHL